jgi:DNA-binding IscR family transcriptional regulator
VEGPVEVAECVLTGGRCHWDVECAVHRFWSAAQDAMRDRLRQTTFDDIARVDAELTGGAGAQVTVTPPPAGTYAQLGSSARGSPVDA